MSENKMRVLLPLQDIKITNSYFPIHNRRKFLGILGEVSGGLAEVLIYGPCKNISHMVFNRDMVKQNMAGPKGKLP